MNSLSSLRVLSRLSQNTFSSCKTYRILTLSCTEPNRVRYFQTKYSKTSASVANVGGEVYPGSVIEGLQHGTFAMQHKTARELLRALVVLRLSSTDFLVSNSEQLLLWSRKLLWKSAFDYMLKNTFFGQFCAGENFIELEKRLKSLRIAGIRSMLCIPIESSIHSEEDAQRRNVRWDKNMEIMLDCINMTEKVEKNGFTQMKITALCGPQLLFAMNDEINRYHANRTQNVDWDVEKVSAAVKTGRFEDIEIGTLNDTENQELRDLLKRAHILAKACRERDLRLMVDAEQSYIQSSINYIVLVLQAIFNKAEPVVYNTYQCYRKDALTRVTGDLSLADELEFKLAGKLVRGAYMDEERKRAKENGYEDPINETYEKTNAMYHSVFDYLLPRVAENEAGVMIASHNESTIEYVIQRMQDQKIEPTNENLCFAQLLGMCDHVSYSLGKFGYQVYKSTPYGTIDDTLLYLSRRAKENRSVASRAQFERKLITTELKYRAGKVIAS